MCTGITFNSANGSMYFGRNLDWNSDFGERIIITPKKFCFPSPFEKPTQSKHAIIGMGIQYEGTPLYFDCGNDAGLAVAGLNFPGYAQYKEAPIEGKKNIAAYEFPYWVCANHSTVTEVLSELQDVAIIAKPVSETLGVSLLHWMIADKTQSIVIEYMADGMHIHQNTANTLTNQPAFDWHLENLRTYITANGNYPETAHWGKASLEPFGAGAGMRGIPGDSYSPSRFVRAAFYNAHYPNKETEDENIIRLFHTLGGVSMVEGSAQMADGTYEITIFTSCFSAETGNYYFSTHDNPSIRYASLKAFEDADPGKVIEPNIELWKSQEHLE